MELSSEAHTLWAKTPSRYGGEAVLEEIGSRTWLSLTQHLRDAADVGALLVQDVLAPKVQQRIARACCGDLETAARFVGFLAGTHDLGKAELCFQSQIEGSPEHGWLWDQVRNLRCHPQNVGWRLDPKPRHAEVSDQILRRELARIFPHVRREAIVSLSSVAGCHHGTLSKLGDSENEFSRGYQMDRWLNDHGGPWHGLWGELIDDILDRTGARPVVGQVLDLGGLSIQDQFLLSGVVTMADWIASNQAIFPLTESGRHYLNDSRAIEAMQRLSLTSAWQPPTGEDPPFRQRFGWPRGAELRPCQTAALNAARSVTGPSLLIIEEEMGQGKTEAALLAAEVITAREGAGGVSFALPTMATTDAMFARFKKWVESLSGSGDMNSHSLFLGHSRSWLNPENEHLIRETRSVDQGSNDELESVVAHEWFTGKRGMLAEFTVSTVDQVLMTALSTRYVTMRHLGLAGKTVILDEVHSYDVYTTDYMARTLTWLAAHEVSVVLLSATLASGLRRQLEEAYAEGLGTAPRPHPVTVAMPAGNKSIELQSRRGRRRRRETASTPVEIHVPPYPRISVTSVAGTQMVPIDARPTHRNVRLEFLDDDVAALQDLVAPLTDQGGVVGIVCNTVQRAQDVYESLVEQFDDGVVTLHHSQFTSFDRMARDGQLVNELGPGATRAGGNRPWRRVVVGTQVLEQSLDVDFDVLVSDLAPTDAIAQRAGRLHRHDRAKDDRPPSFREARVYVRGVDRNGEVPVPDPGSHKIYGDRVLLASMAVLEDYANARPWCLRHELEDSVERTYASGVQIPEAWQEVYEDASREEAAKHRQAQDRASLYQLATPAKSGGYLDQALRVSTVQDAAKSDSIAAAHVRDIEPALEVLLVQSRGGLIGPLPGALPKRYATDEWYVAATAVPSWKFARAIAKSSIRLPRWLVPPWCIDKAIEELEAQGIRAWQEDFRLRGQLVVMLDEQLEGTLLGRSFGYDHRVGLYPVEKDASTDEEYLDLDLDELGPGF